MSVIVEFTIDSDQFVLGRVLALDPDAHVEMERVVPVPTSGGVMSYVWVQRRNPDGFETAVRGSESVRALAALDVIEDGALYRVEWGEQIESLIYGLAETNATILEAAGDDQWHFRIRFDDHSGLTNFHNYCTSHDIRFQLDRVYTVAEDQDGGYAFDLTDAQRSALVTAVRDGYFEVPRRTTLGAVGGKLGVTEQSVSENLRRGANKVLRKALLSPSA
ncbi:DNA-binding protein [Haloplanus salinus]|jgi:predicted DNA binding protein|uniref:DNA-binding protein n=1 Tax=Haloplanus salinus TaxID=1126245 RepID=A0A368N8M0_9EURY|nr:helix-turn-helix domain-containing protein [Haloplanus salinus]RCU46373.1 DNA-binding protein [Haloplanus salinus]